MNLYIFVSKSTVSMFSNVVCNLGIQIKIKDSNVLPIEGITIRYSMLY